MAWLPRSLARAAREILQPAAGHLVWFPTKHRWHTFSTLSMCRNSAAKSGRRLGTEGLTGPIGYWPVEDIKKTLQKLLDAGGQVQQEVKDVGGGKLIAWVKDADANLIGLMQAPSSGSA